MALPCRVVVELASGYLDQDLDPDSHRRVVAHLAGCDGCAQYVDQVRQVVRLSRRAPSPYAAPSAVRPRPTRR